MTSVLRTLLPADAALTAWTRARHAHRARRYWALWNRGAPLAELIETREDVDALAMHFAIDEPPRLDPRERGAALLHFSVEHAAVRWPPGRARAAFAGRDLVMVPSEDAGSVALDDEAAVLVAATRALGLETEGDVTLASILRAHPPVLPTTYKRVLGEPGWTLRCDHGSERDHRWFIERGEDRLWLDPEAGRVRLTPLRELSEWVQDPLPIRLEDARTCPPELLARWCRWLDARAGVRARLAEARAGHVLHAELLEHYRFVYRATRVVDHPRPAPSGHHIYRIDRHGEHPAWGRLERPDAIELSQILLEESVVEPAVVVEDDATPWKVDREGALPLVGVWDDDPTLLAVRAPLGRDPPRSGWLKPVDVGMSVLAQRKLGFMQEGAERRNTARLLERPGESFRAERDPGWPLETRGPLHLVQGPPGTGKTWTATQVVGWILAREPFARILVCAREHLALNHLALELQRTLEKTLGSAGPRLIRVLRDRKALDVLVGEAEALRATALAEGVGKAVWAARRPPGTDALWDWLESERKGLDAPWVAEAARQEASILCCTTTDPWLVDMLGDPDATAFDWLVVEEAGKCYLSDLIAPMALSRQWLLIGDHKQLPPYQLREVKANLERILRVPDDKLGSAADAADLRAARRRWPDITRDTALVAWLTPFRLLFEEAEREPGRAVMLRSQWRMEQRLSDLVGRTFYGAPFEHKKPYRTWRKPASAVLDGRHDLLWIDTPPAVENRRFAEEAAEGRSLRNSRESEVIVALLRSILPDIGELSLAVLTPYQGQKDLLRDKLSRLGGLSDGRTLGALVHTTDEFQGKEKDIILLSLVRNNDRPTPRGRWGFVMDPARLNVMFSRARQVMVVVGCTQHVTRTAFGPDEPLPALVKGFLAQARRVRWNELGVLR